MVSNNSDGQLSNKVTYPEIMVDADNDFASIKIKAGVEARSYLKDGIVFLEDESGDVIEIQILNLSDLPKANKLIAS